MPSVLGSLLRRALSARVSRTQSLGRARGSRRSEHSTQAPPDSTFSVREARAFSEFPVNDAGENVDALPSVAVRRRTGTADYVSLLRGVCGAGRFGLRVAPLRPRFWLARLQETRGTP